MCVQNVCGKSLAPQNLPAANPHLCLSSLQAEGVNVTQCGVTAQPESCAEILAVSQPRSLRSLLDRQKVKALFSNNMIRIKFWELSIWIGLFCGTGLTVGR